MAPERKAGYFDADMEKMDEEKREAFEKEVLRGAIEHAYARAPAMRRKLVSAGVDPASIMERGDLQKIPVTRKAELRSIQEKALPFGEMTGCEVHELKRIYVSPGPTYDPEGRRESHFRWEKAFFAAGFRKGDVVQNTFSYHMSPAGLMFDEALINLGCTVIPAGVGNTEMQAQILKELPVTGYVGTPSFLMTIISKAKETGIDVKKDTRLDVALVAGEMLPESLRKQFFDDFGILVRQCYGTADLGSLGYECFFAKGMHIPDEIILEITEPESGKQLPHGETGEVVVTLNSPVYPLLRFATGDLSYIDDEPCHCGRTSKRLARIVGRVDQVTKVRGMFVYPTQVEKLEGRFTEVLQMQVIVERKDHEDRMTICAVLGEGSAATDELKSKIESEGREVLKLRGTCRFVSVDEIIEGGKKIVDSRKWD